jgi:hypothetical protein
MTSLGDARIRMVTLAALLLVGAALLAASCAAQVMHRLAYNRCVAQESRSWPKPIAQQICARRVR